MILNGKIEFVFWIAIGDDFDVTKWMFSGLPIDLSRLAEIDFCDLLPIIPLLKNAMEEANQYKRNAGKSVGNYNLAKCRYITDQSDYIFARVYGFDKVWDDIELLYVQTIKTDFEADDELSRVKFNTRHDQDQD